MGIPFYTTGPVHAAIKAEVMAFLDNFYDSNLYISGAVESQFTAAYADFCGVRHCVGLSNGLDALQVALRALGIGPGDEVIVPSNTYIASWLSVSNAGAVPIPVEPDPVTWNLDPGKIEAAITSRTRAVMPVHLYGQPCEMDRIRAIADKHGLFIVEDNAQGHGARFNGQPTGSFGHINATSFYPTKNLGALGDAGAVTTNDDRLAAFAAAYKNYGSKVKYHNEMIGVNARLDPIQAGMLQIKLRYLAVWNETRAILATRYLQGLSGIKGIQLPVTATGCTHVWHLFVICVRNRDLLQANLLQQGIQTMIHYPVPPHLQPAYTHLGYREGKFPIAEQIARECLSLPLYPGLGLEQVDLVCAAIIRWAGERL
jgi:dTDP-4-amino-4,6-dideoxygalactose transaminase